MGVVDELIAGREAYERRAWAAAYDRFAGVDVAELPAQDLETMASAAFLVGNFDGSVRAWQRAYQMYHGSGDHRAASSCALWAATVLTTTGDRMAVGGWVSRAQRLLAGEPADSPEHGYLAVFEMFSHLDSGDFAAAHEATVRMIEIGRRCHEMDLLTMGIQSQGRMLMYSGQVRQGLALLDEAMVSIAAGEVSPIHAGMTYCSLIEACQEVRDFERAAEWTSGLTRWCESQPELVAFTGQCAVHRGQIMALRGAFAEALTELDLARRRYEAGGWTPAVGLALTERGNVLRTQGDLDAAEAAYDEASRLGFDPQPGLALLWLARGRSSAAVATVRRQLTEVVDPVHRSRLLPAAVEILVADHQLDEAGAIAAELAVLSDDFGCTALMAMSAYATGLVRQASNDAAEAVGPIRRSWQLWQNLRSPHEAARAQILLGRAYRELGDEESAAASLDAARATLADLGAQPLLDEADRLMRRSVGGLSAREVEVLRLVAAGRSNAEIAQDLVLSQKTVARHLSNIFAKIDVGSRTAAAAFAFEHQLL